LGLLLTKTNKTMKTLKELKGAKELSKKEQKAIGGGKQWCINIICLEWYHCEMDICIKDVIPL
jgi:hypothetical protein